ncbi:hypothetical protein NQ176_g5575 [Zarea fungicola]|uniref:Uncharacterized protein n=1 Tax=Zarea fungicola TaxID=93591 RepID=A0ACC1N9P5_9HYPO|nr:hypothetical protein NQ176_g5575 [Lecanicillium fungicola]
MLLKTFLIASVASCATARVSLAGINIAGFEFGCDNHDAFYTQSRVTPPLRSPAQPGHADGVGQMQHFVTDDGMNVFRLPVCWQYLVDSKLGGPLDKVNFGRYDQLVQACLETGAHCIIDIHNYARWEGSVIGQSDNVTNQDFASIWSHLGAEYATSSRIIFGIMNEPHNLDINAWAASAQAAVTAIRTAGATSQLVLLSGTVYDSLGAFISDGSATALSAYLDSDTTGKSAECASNGIDNLKKLTAWLRQNNRKALLTETGGGSTSSCYNDVCAELDWINNNAADVIIGWVGWAAGAFSTSYPLSETPTQDSNGVWNDTGIVANCIAGKFH